MADILSVSSTAIECTTPPGSVGMADVVVTNLDGTSFTVSGGFTYAPAAAPTVSAVTPSTGPSGGGTAVLVDGTGFQSGAQVAFGPTTASACQTLAFRIQMDSKT